MSLSATITIIFVADIALIALVAFVMSRASLLKPHGRLTHELGVELERGAHAIASLPRRRVTSRPMRVGVARPSVRS